MLERIFSTLLRPLARSLAVRRLPPDMAAGDLYAIPAREEGFAVLKVLAVDDGVHVRLYRQRYAHIPSATDVDELSLGVFTVGGNGPDAFSIGHLPLTRKAFAVSGPVRIGRRPILPEELDGYEIWLESLGGYFDRGIL
jgi:hypothetical protein